MNRRLFVVFILLAMVCLGGMACSKGNKSDLEIAKMGSFFPPLKLGTVLTYKITFGSAEPLAYREVNWPIGNNNEICQAIRSRFIAYMKRKNDLPMYLKLQIIQAVHSPGSVMKWPGVGLKVLQDDLGVFEDCSAVYWSIINPENPELELVTMYSANSSGAPSGSWGNTIVTADGWALRSLFFNRGPQVSSSWSKGRDALLCLTIEDIAGKKLLHFQRQVTASKSDQASGLADHNNVIRTVTKDNLGAPFTEDMYYEQGRGLVRLVQMVNGQRSMTWELESVH